MNYVLCFLIYWLLLRYGWTPNVRNTQLSNDRCSFYFKLFAYDYVNSVMPHGHKGQETYLFDSIEQEEELGEFSQGRHGRINSWLDAAVRAIFTVGQSSKFPSWRYIGLLGELNSTPSDDIGRLLRLVNCNEACFLRRPKLRPTLCQELETSGTVNVNRQR